MKLASALEKLGLSTEQIEERVNELRELSDSDEKLRRSYELYQWILLIELTNPGLAIKEAKSLGLTPDEVASLFEVRKEEDNVAKTSMGVVAKAKSVGEDIYESFSAWRQTPECWRVITRDKEQPSGLKTSAFAYFITTQLDPKVRAELLAKVELYCQSGWADADLMDGEPETQAAKELRKIVERMEKNKKPPVTAEEAANAVSARFNELFLDIKIMASEVEGSSNRIYTASIGLPGQSGFDPVGMKAGGRGAGGGFVDVAIKPHPSHTNPNCLLVAAVTKGNPYGDQAETHMKHDSAIRAFVGAGGIPEINSVEFSRYGPPAVYGHQTSNEINREIVRGMDDDIRTSTNLAFSLADLDCAIGDPSFDRVNYLRSKIHLFGAPDPWAGVLKEAEKSAFSDHEAANRMLVKRGFNAVRNVLQHFAESGKFTKDSEADKLGLAVIHAACGLYKGFGGIGGLDEDITALANAANALVAEDCMDTKTYTAIVDRRLKDWTASLAKDDAKNYAPSKERVEFVRRKQEQLQNRLQDPQDRANLLPSGIGEWRQLKADFGREVSALIQKMALECPAAFPGDSAHKLAATFERFCQVADGSFPSMIAGKGNESSYNRVFRYKKQVISGEQDAGPLGVELMEDYLPWVQLHQPDDKNPAKSIPPDLTLLETKIRLLGNKAQKPKAK